MDKIYYFCFHFLMFWYFTDNTETVPSEDSKTLKSVKKNYEMIQAFLLQEYDKGSDYL